jgi:hypothetical protein
MSKYLSVFYLLFIICGCKNSSTDNNIELNNDPFSTLSKDSVIVSNTPLTSKIVFSFTESISISGRPFELLFNTVALYGGGRNIVGRITRNGLHIVAHLDSITTNGGGPGMSLPGTIRFNLGILSNNLYDFIITVNGKDIQALLLVTDSSYIVKIQPNNFVSSNRPRLLRVPKNIIWGQAESILPLVYQNFLDSLIVVGAKPGKLLVGDYMYFKIISPDSFYIPSVLGMRYGKFFIYQFDSDTSLSRNLVKSFAKKYGDSAYVQLNGGRGEMYYTTVLK